MAVKTLFNIPYAGVDKDGEYDLLIGLNGECSVVIQLVNPVIRYSAYPAGYEEFHHLLINVVKILGDGYLLQKQDIISRSPYKGPPSSEYLQKKYNAHFEGRECLQVATYLTITRQVKKGAFYVYDRRVLRDFRQAIGKVLDVLPSAKALIESQLNQLVLQMLSMDFGRSNIVLDNIAPSETEIRMGEKSLRCISLVNIDSIDLPPDVSTHIELNDKESMRGFPVDFMSFLFKVPGVDVIVYNQVIEIPNQIVTLRKLEQKKKRHSGIPDPANQLCVEDIDLLLNDVARESQLLVNCHFNILVAAPVAAIQKAVNFVESSLFQLGIIPSKNAYNQLELFRTALPGNGVELKEYDWFLTTCDAAICFFFKESLPKDEPSDFLIKFTDRQGIPVGMDPADLPMRTGRINNRNKFVLGPSGSGKSFFMNALIEQYMLYNMDMVIVDTGHSYSGLCSYYNGKYITYTDKNPITMNPFRITEAEYNIEKKDFLCTLIGVTWKGAEGTLSPVERDVIANVISAYYSTFFAENGDLSFNTFYEFALEKIPEIKTEERIVFDFDEFKYVLKKFYKGGEFARLLNEDTDKSLFTERFIVYEIDSIKENKTLFPLVTLTIMDVFIQKMRYRSNRRKALVVEEAWKAIASPLMAGYLLYLYKTVRKFWGEAIVVTQELGDIIGNVVVKDSIINNSDTICLLDQTKFKDNYNDIAALLSINETERRKIFTINQLDNTENRGRFKEVYIRRGAVGEVYGVEVSLQQYLTYTTEKPEKSAVESYTSRFGSYPDGLDAFIRDFKGSGKSLPAFISQVNQNQQP
ncbi:TraG family conjugative transposon ATPase [Mucilaginibacter rubeus]|uniref:TraG family conjugative transposon ATPase n=2 Tax=Mucilaginibacter rubeus TaxID=2027860 RepID=A0A364WWL9_9SPHI|nr:MULTISPECIES: TraG family conjugative transposon ATPase [Mucilaginibacter]QEM06218.1 TraG family conjugative transposon ATPase [Mucilaginibacter rubeus]QEM13735.1 TraG family conjugative transposon ATPase [Mucilaginibacter rubeus]QEM18801.1 TraG family conjugative transposon ATPase [Mucilaginibacter gossypii]QTE36204.1 TraG family conjugative transposon ATPase [Mucilaginibacter gossypii]QTE44657.1 TraG family conjugative transposon ATPase [Mucilaginibacter rubeus]